MKKASRIWLYISFDTDDDFYVIVDGIERPDAEYCKEFKSTTRAAAIKFIEGITFRARHHYNPTYTSEAEACKAEILVALRRGDVAGAVLSGGNRECDIQFGPVSVSVGARK